MLIKQIFFGVAALSLLAKRSGHKRLTKKIQTIQIISPFFLHKIIKMVK
jgi:hypothetical protein